MPTNYPNNIDSYSVHTDNINENIAAAHVNNLQDSVKAIENELGTNPKGTKTDVKTRIVDIETDIINKFNTATGHDHDGIDGKKIPVTSLDFDVATQVELDAIVNATTGHKHTGAIGDAPIINIVSDSVKTNNDNILWHNGNCASNKTTSGYQKLGGGLILQWTFLSNIPFSSGVSGSYAFNFPIIFPNACLSLMGSVANASLSLNNISASYEIVDQSVARVHAYAGTLSQELSFYIMAIGY